MDSKLFLPYRVGALMYVPALNSGVAEKICSGAFSGLSSLAFCLEDSIADGGVRDAEIQLFKSMADISASSAVESFPLFFVRVRDCGQLARLPDILGKFGDILTGVIFPKFDLSNGERYLRVLGDINDKRAIPLRFMPILESSNVIQLGSRWRELAGLRKMMDSHREHVLNIRVGAMDFCKPYGLRRAINRSIYDIAVVRDVLADILNVFADDYVVSAPVWEYFRNSGGCNDRTDSEQWRIGLENELELDIANGFIGKTIIHPLQIQPVLNKLRPSIADVNDAKRLVDVSESDVLGVSKSFGGN